ncbi:Imm51 family immunity protein [uncultured Corynebacterium sp.]|uniref:Imm51 family immunity protein n=1 Tax=uncultured Corynebacterium sp. TaxID=159447 RepID=UPI00344A1872
MTSLLATTDAIPQQTAGSIAAAGHTPNGYFFNRLATHLIHQSGNCTDDIKLDSDAGMFSPIGPHDVLQPLRDRLTQPCDNPHELQQTLEQARGAGVDFDD